MTCKNITVTLLCIFLNLSSWALVDYTESDNFVPQNSGASIVPKARPKVRSKRAAPKRSGQAGGPKRFSTDLTYSSTSVNLGGTSGKVGITRFKGHFETDYNIFMDASYYRASTSDAALLSRTDSRNESGNPEVRLGFNWLNIGRAQDAVTVDLVGGYSFGQKNALFASSRNDKIVGVMTAKRFHRFVLGLGYELYLTGAPTGEESDVGHITMIEASLGWVVSHDIRFLINTRQYSLGAGDGENSLSAIKFGTVSPKLMLALSPSVHMTLGADFRSRRLKDDDFLNAKLWNLTAPYGNTLSVGMSFML